MIRYGAPAPDMGPMTKDSLFRSRLKLLIIMAKAIDNQYPLGSRRRRAVIENADFVFYESLYRSVSLRSEMSHGSQTDAATFDPDREQTHANFLWLQRVQLLAVMTKSMADGNPMGKFRKQAFTENLRIISDQCGLSVDLSQMPFLKVA